MSSFQSPKAADAGRGTTLNSLKDQLYSLNMRMLLAMQSHSDEAQEEIKAKIAQVQSEIAQMSVGRRYRR